MPKLPKGAKLTKHNGNVALGAQASVPASFSRAGSRQDACAPRAMETFRVLVSSTIRQAKACTLNVLIGD